MFFVTIFSSYGLNIFQKMPLSTTVARREVTFMI